MSWVDDEHDWADDDSGVKPCAPIPCPSFTEARLDVLPWVPTVDELRLAGAAIGQPDGSYYLLRDGVRVHVNQGGSELPE